MKHRKLMVVVFVIVFAALLHHFEKPVMAQVRAALVKNIDERGRSPFVLRATCSAVSGTNYCMGTFSPVPANKRFVAEYVNGSASIFGATIESGIVNVHGVPNILILDPHLASTLPGFNNYVISMPVLAYFESGQIPYVEFVSPSGGIAPSAGISISGYLVDLTE